MRNKEQAILEAAEREFIVKGFAGARTTSIAEAAGVTHAMLHYYFRTKEQLFERILDEKMRLMGESVLAAFGQPGLPLAERLRDGIERHFDFIMANPDMPRFIVNEVFSRPERYETMQARIREIAGVLMCDIQRSSTPRPTAAKRKGSTCGCCCSTSSRSTSFRSSPILSSNRFWVTSRPTANVFSHGAGRKTRR